MPAADQATFDTCDIMFVVSDTLVVSGWSLKICLGFAGESDVSICSRAQRSLCMKCNTNVTCFGHR